ncbi:uncharacterized protein LOC134716792 [Mytilus trossulus]|uniref:uncharacterized protein LOC134716792 n=1 Tax=Mytilus trossulus TaxID=6551 RepID=UPI003007578D
MLEIQSEAFKGLTAVEKINLENNELKTIKRNTFIDMPKLNVIILQGNDIIEIEQNAFGDLPELLYLSLLSNNIICNCKIRPFHHWILQRSKTIIDGGVCSDLNGQQIKDLLDVEECIETSTVPEVSPTTKSVSSKIKTSTELIPIITTVKDDEQDVHTWFSTDMKKTSTEVDVSPTTTAVSTKIKKTTELIPIITVKDSEQDVRTWFSTDMKKTTSSIEREIVTVTTTEYKKNTIGTTNSPPVQITGDKLDTNIFHKVTLLGVMSCIVAALAFNTACAGCCFLLFLSRRREKVYQQPRHAAYNHTIDVSLSDIHASISRFESTESFFTPVHGGTNSCKFLKWI